MSKEKVKVYIYTRVSTVLFESMWQKQNKGTKGRIKIGSAFFIGKMAELAYCIGLENRRSVRKRRKYIFTLVYLKLCR